MNKSTISAVNCKGTLTVEPHGTDEVQLTVRYDTDPNSENVVVAIVKLKDLQRTLWMKNQVHLFKFSTLRRVVRNVRIYKWRNMIPYRRYTIMELYTDTTNKRADLMVVRWNDLKKALY